MSWIRSLRAGMPTDLLKLLMHFYSSKLDIAPLLKHSRGPFSPEPSGKPALRTGMDIGSSDAPSESWHRFHPAVPSGRDMTSEVSRNADVAPAPRLRVPSGMSWVAAGVLSAIGATALYFFVSGNAIKNSAPTSVTLSTAAVQQDQNVAERPSSVASWPSKQWVEPPPNDFVAFPEQLRPGANRRGCSPQYCPWCRSEPALSGDHPCHDRAIAVDIDRRCDRRF